MKYTTTLFLLFFAFMSFAQFSFNRFDLNETLDGIESIHSVDFDNDGDMDIFAASRNDNKVTLFEQVLDGFFHPTVLSSDVAGASVVKSYDFDQDGDLDIIASSNSPGDHSLSWWENVNGQFSTRKLIVNINNQAFQDFQIADLDEDGDLDIVSVEFATVNGAGSLAMWVNDNFNFELLELSDQSIDGRQIELIDWDGDGDLDFLIAEGIGDRMAFWENKGNLEYEKNTLFTFDVCNSFAVADFNEDGRDDIIALSFTEDEVSFWLNNGDNTFTRTVLEDQFDAPDKLVVNDIDQDGDLDVIVAFYLDDLLVIYENTGTLEYTQHIIDNDFDGGRDLFIVDIDNDNALDILGAALSDKRAVGWINNQVISSTEELQKEQTLVYPNPSNGILTISDVSERPVSIWVSNHMGQKVKEIPFSNTVDLSDIGDGIYFIQLNYVNSSEIHKVVIQGAQR